MNNNIMDNIKRNLERDHTGKCYGNFGYIEKIFEIKDDIKGGVIRAEDYTSSSVHRVKFTCRICNPIVKSMIVGKITGINNMLIVAENGPIRFMIGASDINKNNIQFRKSAYYPITSKGKVIDKPINKGTHVMIQVMSKRIVKKKTSIIVFGRLESVVSDDSVLDSIRNQYESNEYVNAEDLITNPSNQNHNQNQIKAKTVDVNVKPDSGAIGEHIDTEDIVVEEIESGIKTNKNKITKKKR